MRIASVIIGMCALLVCGAATAPPVATLQATNGSKAIPLILEKNEGERRVVRGYPGHPEPGETFILKIDPKNGGSPHLVLLTADLEPGKEIEAHRHPEADEILFLQSGTARVHVGDVVKVAHAGATVFIPANTWISLDNIGKDPIHLVGIFSKPGFEEFMRETSALEGEKNVPMSPAENDQVEKKHAHAVIYKQP